MMNLWFCLLIIILIIKADDPIHTAIIYGSSDLGYYYVNMFVGNPPQKQSVIIDTASSITTFPCSTCKSCGHHIDQPFNLEASNTIIQVDCRSTIGLKKCDVCDTNGKCTFHISYAEGSSLSGYYLFDYALFGDELMDLYNAKETQLVAEEIQVQSVFGCTTSETNLFYTQAANGIMGLSPKTNSTFSYPSLVDFIVEKEQKMNVNYLFSICIGRLNGYMTIGNYDKSRHEANSVYHTIKYYRNQGDIYGIKILNVMVGNQTIIPSGLAQKGQGTFIDSGSTVVNAHSEISSQFQSSFNCQASDQTRCPAFANSEEGFKCYVYDQPTYKTFNEFFSLFPTYQFQLENNFTFDWTPNDYLIKDLNNQSLYCLPVFTYNAQPQRLILGQVWMRNWDIAFDKGKEELTFVRSKCSTSKISHNFTDEELYQLEQQSNFTKRPTLRVHPHSPSNELLGELIKLIAILGFAGLLLLIAWLYKRRKLLQRAQNQSLQDLEQPEENKPQLEQNSQQ